MGAEELLTDGAGEVLDPGVGLDVGAQRRVDAERLEAVRALERLLVRVHAHVAHEVARLLELLRAVDALVPPHAVHLRRQMRKVKRWRK